MNYLWKDPRNAVGFAAACARAALQFYEGDGRDVLVRAIKIAEACSRGRCIDRRATYAIAYAIANADHTPNDAANAAAYATANAVYTAYATANTAPNATHAATDAAANAAKAGVPRETIDKLHAKWIVKDLGGDLRTNLGKAVFALASIHEYEHAARLLEEARAA